MMMVCRLICIVVLDSCLVVFPVVVELIVVRLITHSFLIKNHTFFYSLFFKLYIVMSEKSSKTKITPRQKFKIDGLNPWIVTKSITQKSSKSLRSTRWPKKRRKKSETSHAPILSPSNARADLPFPRRLQGTSRPQPPEGGRPSRHLVRGKPSAPL